MLTEPLFDSFEWPFHGHLRVLFLPGFDSAALSAAAKSAEWTIVGNVSRTQQSESKTCIGFGAADTWFQETKIKKNFTSFSQPIKSDCMCHRYWRMTLDKTP